MKKLILLSVFSVCCASEKDGGVHVNNTVTITNPAPVVVKRQYPSPKHPKVIEAHEKIARQQADDDFMTCCCFLKIKKLK